MGHQDRSGLPISTASDIAAACYREGVDLLLAAWPGAAEALEAAIAADPQFALAHAARARLHAIRAEPEQAKARIAAAAECVGRHGTERERSHVEILGFAIAGQPAQALRRALEHADNWPRDAVILSLPLGAFGLFAFSGMADHDQARVELCERHAAAYGDDWWFLTYHGWAHTEHGDIGIGRQLTQRGFDLRPRNAHALHALSHAMFEDGSSREADALITGWLPGYDRGAPLYSHISWHQALIALEAGDVERALTIYADRVRPAVTAAAPINVVSDGASLLWRMQAYGHPAPRRHWDELAEYAERAFPTAGFAFIDVHMALIAAANGDGTGLERRVTALAARIEAGAFVAGPAVPEVCRAMLAFAEADYAGCVHILEPVAAEVVRIGGSHAQREVVEDTLLVALMRSGQAAKAHALLDGRLHRRPSPRDHGWRTMLNG